MSGLRLTGVLGYPAAHSKSPMIHNTWLKRAGLNGLYAPIEVSPGHFEAWLRIARDVGFVGFNVTIPHKTAAYRAAEVLTETARRCGSVNTLWWDGAGRLNGDSTDGFGFIENLRRGAPDFTFAGARVALLGAGGASQAVAMALVDAGVGEIAVFNRTKEKATALAAASPETIVARTWPPTAADLAAADLLVNGTSLGMTGQPPLELDWPALRVGVVATDLVYTPLETPFLNAAAAAGARVVDGLGMLLHQAQPGFERWYGQTPEVDGALRRAVLDSVGYLP